MTAVTSNSFGLSPRMIERATNTAARTRASRAAIPTAPDPTRVEIMLNATHGRKPRRICFTDMTWSSSVLAAPIGRPADHTLARRHPILVQRRSPHVWRLYSGLAAIYRMSIDYHRVSMGRDDHGKAGSACAARGARGGVRRHRVRTGRHGVG